MVNLIMFFVNRTKSSGPLVTPHICGGTDLSKVQWEYDRGPDFFRSIGNHISIDILDGKDILDAGCGWGGKMIYYAENTGLKTIHGFDLPGYLPDVSQEFAVKKNINNCFFKNGYAENMPYTDSMFDAVIMEDVLEHVADPDKVIQECYRVLRPGGIVIIKFPSFKGMFSHHLDRALTLPALHYILPMKTWTGGLNYLLSESIQNYGYSPFDKIVSTDYHRSITKNLNGLDFNCFNKIIAKSNFNIKILELVPFIPHVRKAGLKICLYHLVYRNIKVLREFLSSCILFIGEKKE